MMAANSNARMDAAQGAADAVEYVTVTVGEAVFGLPISRVHDVFIATNLTRVPLAPREIRGLLNLRGRVVTALCLRRRLGMPDRASEERMMAVGIEQAGEAYSLIVDAVGEVMRLGPDTHEPNPATMDPRWRQLASGVHRLEGRLLVILDVEAVLAFDASTANAA